MAPVIAWFRNDLRLHDHPALHAAIERGSEVLPLFVFDSRLTDGSWASANRNAFLADCVEALGKELTKIGGNLVIRVGQPEVVVPTVAKEVGASEVFVTRDYSPFARTRDRRVSAALQTAGATLHARRGRLIVEPEEVLTATGKPFEIFSPFERRWNQAGRERPIPAPASIRTLPGISSGRMPTFTATATHLIEGGERAAGVRLGAFTSDGRLERYASDRDLLAATGTSGLSADLHFGTLSPLAVAEAAGATWEPGVRSALGSSKFVSELAWREFYAHLLWHNPSVLRKNFRSGLERVPWRNDPEQLERWKNGETGYPVVDAAMRQLRETGWMHNRARMVVASFLTKHLLIHWREGEAHFMHHLVDGDVASNNGGWQWAASTGADSQPYFRIFNPILQGKRFDAEGEYVRRWVPELRRVPAADIHTPWLMSEAEQNKAACVIGRDYPSPIVEHQAARDRALAAFGQPTAR